MNILAQWFGLQGNEFNDLELHFNVENAIGLGILMGILIPVALAFFWTGLSRIRSSGKKVFLWIIRTLVFLILLLVLFRPVLEFKATQLQKKSIALVLDNSKSMSIKTFPEEESRFETVLKTIEKNLSYLESLGQKFNLDVYFASDALTPTGLADIRASYFPRGHTTDLNKVLVQLKERYAEKYLKAVMLFSDGADLDESMENISDTMSETLASFKTPILTFQAGTNQSFKDLGIERFQSADFGFIYQPINLKVTLNASSMGNKNVPLIVKEDDKVLVTKTLEIRESQKHYEVDLQFAPNTLGKRVYSVSVPLFAGESIETNNRREFQVKVVRDRIRVLHLNGRPSWDSRFLREVLIHNPKVDLLSFYILRTLSDDVAATTAELSLIPFPSNLLLSDYLDSFNLVIFHNFRYAPFIEKKYLENIRQYVLEGGAFIMIGGELAFQGGGYSSTAVEEILPVHFARKTKAFLPVDFEPRIPEKYLRHPVLRLEKNEKQIGKVWTKLPHLMSLNTGLKPAKDSQVLMDYPQVGSEEFVSPVLALKKVGKGRTMALATDSSWNWNFLLVGEGGSGRYYQKFWDMVIAWMTDQPETRTLKIQTDKERYKDNEKVLIKITTLKDDYNPSSKEKIRLTLRSLSQKRAVETFSLESGRNGTVNFEYSPLVEGFYEAQVERTMPTGSNFRDERFGVFSPTAEFEKPMINSHLLKTISQVTGGTYQVVEESFDLAQFKFSNPQVRVKTKSKTFALWNSWWSYGLIVGLLSLDWWFRRKSGLS